MPLLKSAKTLRKICIRSIVRHIDKVWCADYRENYFEKVGGKFLFIDGPFDQIDPASVHDVLQILAGKNRISKVYLHLLIVPGLVEIDLSGAAKYTTNDIVDLICTRCRGMKSIDLAGCDRISPQYLIMVVRSFQATLTKLCLTRTKLNDKVLEAIGAHCSVLHCLKINMCRVSRKGMERLFYIADPINNELTQFGKSVSTLFMMGCDFDNDIEFLAQILLNCTSLRFLSHFSLWESIIKYCETISEPEPLHLIGVKYNLEINLWNFRNHLVTLPVMARCLPEIQHLAIAGVDGMDIPLFNLVSCCRKTLKSLKLDWSLPYEFLLYIGLLCPQLDTLMITISEAAEINHSFTEVKHAFEDFILNHDLPLKEHIPWSKLEQLFIHWPSPDNRPLSPSVPVLESIIKGSASSLSYLNLHWMPDKDIDMLLTRALDNGYFDMLETLHLNGAVHLTTQSMWDLVLSAPRLKLIDFCSCPLVRFSEYLEIAEYVQKNNFALKVEIDF